MANPSESIQSASNKVAPVAPVDPVVLRAAFLVQRGREGFGMLVVTIDDESIQSHPSFSNVNYFTFSFLDEQSRKLDFVLLDAQREGGRCLYFFEPVDDKIMESSPADMMLFHAQSLMMGRKLRSDIMALAFPPAMAGNSEEEGDTAHVVVALKRPRLSCFIKSSNG